MKENNEKLQEKDGSSKKKNDFYAKEGVKLIPQKGRFNHSLYEYKAKAKPKHMERLNPE